MTPKAYRLFQSRLLTEIFSELQASRSGRHQGPVVGDGAVEMQQTKPYEFGDSVTHMDIPASLINAMLRDGPGLPVRLKPDDIEIHRTRNNPKCATAVLLDMSGSMRHGSQYVNVKRMGLALDGLIKSEYPGDFLQFIEMYTFAKPRHVSEIAALMPKPVTLYDPSVRLQGRHERSEAERADDAAALHQHPARPAIGSQVPVGAGHAQSADHPHHRRPADGSLRGRVAVPALSAATRGPSRRRCARRSSVRREDITINIFLLSNWNQTEEDVHFAYRVAESTRGRVFFTAGRDLDRYVVWDYIARRRQIIA